jgi:pimeloyl-ACP methyl ester carboxylesterase
VRATPRSLALSARDEFGPPFRSELTVQGFGSIPADRTRRTEMTTAGGSVETKTAKVPGATLYVEIRGSGPVLLCITGGPTDAGVFTDLAGRLADRYTVVAYDQRGHSRSTLDDAPEDIPVHVHADDAAEILTAMDGEPAYVYGNSGGATIGLELVARHTDLVRTLVAHEAPLAELVPDAERLRSVFEDVIETYRSEGAFPAMAKFGVAVEEGGPKYSEQMQQMPSTPESEEMTARMVGNFDLFLAHELMPIIGYVPDVDALRSVPSRIVPTVGETSGEQLARRATAVLAERLGVSVAHLPGGHGGWASDPGEFAERLDVVLRS